MNDKKVWRVGWNGFGVREALGFTWTDGVIHEIVDEMVALELLTQPNDGFFEPPTITNTLEEEGEENAISSEGEFRDGEKEGEVGQIQESEQPSEG